MQYIPLLCTDQHNVELILPKHLQTKLTNHEVQGKVLIAAIWSQVVLTTNQSALIDFVIRNSFVMGIVLIKYMFFVVWQGLVAQILLPCVQLSVELDI